MLAKLRATNERVAFLAPGRPWQTAARPVDASPADDEVQQRRAVGHALSAQINAHEAAQCRAVQQRLFTSLIGQVEPVLHEVHPQHALQAHWRAAVAGLRVVRFDHLAQCVPGNDLVHRRKEHIALGCSEVLFESGALIGCCGKGLLLHPATTQRRKGGGLFLIPKLRAWGLPSRLNLHQDGVDLGEGGRQRSARSASPCMPPIRVYTELHGSV
ncbi:hypothetical protein SAMN05444679_12436 [Variovorax sp. CF079]|nr:hypothetical protein SAMN05444679_12436 [Variovorax sp. CF079]